MANAYDPTYSLPDGDEPQRADEADSALDRFIRYEIDWMEYIDLWRAEQKAKAAEPPQTGI